MIRLSSCSAAALVIALMTGCSQATFLIDKDGAAAYFGREQSYLHAMLCERGDLPAITRDAELPHDMQEDFYRSVCSDQRSYDKVASLYLFLTPEQKKKLHKAFEKRGYKVNQGSCCG